METNLWTIWAVSSSWEIWGKILVEIKIEENNPRRLWLFWLGCFRANIELFQVKDLTGNWAKWKESKIFVSFEPESEIFRRRSERPCALRVRSEQPLTVGGTKLNLASCLHIKDNCTAPLPIEASTTVYVYIKGVQRSNSIIDQSLRPNVAENICT